MDEFPPRMDALTNVKQWIDRRRFRSLLLLTRRRTHNNNNNNYRATDKDQQQPQPKSKQFHIHAWRWHHLGIVADLNRLQQQLHTQKRSLCIHPSSAASAQLRHEASAALDYIIQDNLNIHNDVQHKLLIPWLTSRLTTGNSKEYTFIDNETLRLSRSLENLSSSVRVWSKATHNTSTKCEVQVHTFHRQIVHFHRQLHDLFTVSERIVVPAVLRGATEHEQKQFNQLVMKTLEPKQIRLAAVAFKSAIESHAPDAQATAQDRRDFKHSVPGVVRSVAIPYWKSKLVKKRADFLQVHEK